MSLYCLDADRVAAELLDISLQVVAFLPMRAYAAADFEVNIQATCVIRPGRQRIKTYAPGYFQVTLVRFVLLLAAHTCELNPPPSLRCERSCSARLQLSAALQLGAALEGQDKGHDTKDKLFRGQTEHTYERKIFLNAMHKAMTVNEKVPQAVQQKLRQRRPRRKAVPQPVRAVQCS